MAPKISIIIPAHNEENYIKRTLHSIKQQTYQNYEAIVVSNGCTDKTEDIVNKRANEKLKHFSISEANVSKARNFGAKFAYGDILLFLDADTTLEEDSLQKIKDQFTEQFSVATTRSDADDKKFRFSLLMTLKNFYNSTGLYQSCSGALICNKADFDKVNGYPELVVKEHRKLVVNIKKSTGKEFKYINTNATTSMRRFKQWGISKAALFWLQQWWNNFFGDLKKSEYEKIR
jgi:glycosyltransferase involved in cell wall biosynthesis